MPELLRDERVDDRDLDRDPKEEALLLSEEDMSLTVPELGKLLPMRCELYP